MLGLFSLLASFGGGRRRGWGGRRSGGFSLFSLFNKPYKPYVPKQYERTRWGK